MNYKLFVIMPDKTIEDAYYVQAIKENKLFSSPEKAFDWLLENDNNIAHREYIALPYMNMI